METASTVAELVGGGWPLVLSALKTLLEIGETLPTGQDATRQDAEVAR